MSKQIEFEVDNASLEAVNGLIIKANFEDMGKALKEITKPYKNLVVSEKEIAGARADRAKIRKVEKNIDDYRKMVKKAYEVPIKEFEEKCKSLTGICKEASDNLDSQIKNFETEAKKKKLERLYEIYKANIDEETGRYLGWAKVQNPRWGNATFDTKDAEEEILERIEETRNDVRTIKAMGSEFEIELLRAYEDGNTLREIIELNSRLVNRKKEMQLRKEAELRKEKEMESPHKEDAKKIGETPGRAKEPASMQTQELDEDEKIFVLDFRVQVNAPQLDKLKCFLKENQIRYGRVPR